MRPRYFAFAVLVLLFAAATASYAFAPPLSVSGNVTTVGNGTLSAASVGRATFTAAPNGAVFVQTGIQMPTGGGRTVPMVLQGSVSKPNVAGAVGRFLGKVIMPLAAGVALYDLAQELGYGVSNQSGPVVVTRPTLPAPDGSYDATGHIAAPAGWIAACTATHKLSHLYVDPGCAVFIDPVPNASGSTCGRSDGYCVVVRPRLVGAFDAPTAVLPGQYWHGAISAIAPGALNLPSLPSTAQELADAVAAKSGWPSSSALARTLRDAITYGEAVPVQVDHVTGPATSPGETVVTKNPDGTVTTRTSTTNHGYSGPSTSTTTTTTTTTVDPVTGTPTGPSTVTTTTPALPSPAEPPAPQELPEIETCGLPGKPACKIDEAGTPEAPELDPAKEVTDAVKPLQDLIDDPGSVLPSLPSLNWTFSLPTACGPISLPAFAPYLTEVDVCQFQPLFHDVMSLVWIIGGLFGAIGTFWRNVFSQG